MRDEQFIFYENVLCIGQIENLWMDDVYIQFRETEMVEIP